MYGNLIDIFNILSQKEEIVQLLLVVSVVVNHLKLRVLKKLK